MGDIQTIFPYKQTPHFEITLQGGKKFLENFQEFVIFVGMKRKLVYDFLDNVVGNGVTCKKLTNRGRSGVYRIKSNKGYTILDFMVSTDGNKVSLIAGNELYNMVSLFFSMEHKMCLNYIRDWFGDKHDLKKINDVKKFIPQIDIK